MSSGSTSYIIGALIDLNASEDHIRDLIISVRPPQCPVKELVEEVEKHQRWEKFIFCGERVKKQCFFGSENWL